MPITVKTKTLLESRDALKELSDISIPVRTALKLRKIYRSVENDLEATQEQLKKLAEKHAKKDSDGKTVHPMVKDGEKEVADESKVEIEDKKAYTADIDSLMDVEVTINFDPIKVEDLVDPKDPPQKVKTSLVFALDWLLEG